MVLGNGQGLLHADTDQTPWPLSPAWAARMGPWTRLVWLQYSFQTPTLEIKSSHLTWGHNIQTTMVVTVMVIAGTLRVSRAPRVPSTALAPALQCGSMTIVPASYVGGRGS